MCVNIANGEVSLSATDVAIPGPVPIVLSRSYSSNVARTGLFGVAWSENLGIRLALGREHFTVHGPESAEVRFPPVSVGGSAVDQPEPLGQSVLDRLADSVVVTRPGGERLVFEPGTRRGADWRLAYRSDAAGNVLRHVYNAQDQLEGLVDFREREMRLVYHGSGLLAEVMLVATDRRQPPERLVTYEYDDGLRLTAVINATGGSTHYRYDDGLLVTYTNPLGGETYFAYDKSRRCIGTWQADGRLCRFLQFHPTKRMTILTNTLGERTVYRFNEADLPLERVDALGAVKTTTYDLANAILATNDEEASDGSVLLFDAASRELRKIDPAGSTTVERQDSAGRTVDRIDANGQSWALEYNSFGKLVSRTSPLKARWTYRYNRRGFIEAVVDPRGREITITRSADYSEVVWSDAQGMINRLTFDFFGRLVKEVNSAGGETAFDYDAGGRLRRVTGPDGAAVGLDYDAAGNLIQTRDALGRRWQTQYDKHGNPIAVVDPEQRWLTVTYDAECRLDHVTNEDGEEAHFAYDPLARCTEVRFFDGSVQRLEFGDSDLLAAIIQPDGTRIVHEHNPVGRLLSRCYPNGTSSKFDYDQTGLLVGAENSNSLVTFEWDADGRLTRECQGDEIVDYGYDPAGALVDVLTADRTVHFVRDLRGRVVRVEDSAAGTYDITYDPRNRGVVVHGPGGLRIASTYDIVGRLREQRAVHRGRQVHARQYVYDAVGRLREITEEPGPRRIAIEYDVIDRVTLVAVDGTVVGRYAYDCRGNMITSPHVAIARYGRGNRLIGTDVNPVESDPIGRVVRRAANGEAVSYTYGYEHELLTVDGSSASPVEYRYDALLRRTAKRVGPDETRYIWLGDRQWRASGPGGTLDYVTLGASGQLLAQVIDGIPYDAITDHLGSPVALVSRDGNIAWRCFLPFLGEQVNETSCPLRFPGQEFDPETGLVYNRFRYFDPATSRYLSPDPLPFLQGANAFSYVDNDFLNQLDPLGLSGCFDPECDRLYKEMDNWINTANGQAPHPNNAPINGNANAHFRGIRERAEQLARNRGQQPLRRLPGDPLGQRHTILSHRRAYAETQVGLQNRLAQWDAAGCQPRNTSDPSRAGRVQQDARTAAVADPPPIRHVGDPAQVFGKVTIQTPFGVGY